MRRSGRSQASERSITIRDMREENADLRATIAELEEDLEETTNALVRTRKAGRSRHVDSFLYSTNTT